MGFTNNYSNASMEVFENKPEGDYEVIVSSIEEKQFKTGTIGLNVKMLIRNDVDQASKNGYLFHTFWKRKSPSDMDKQVKNYSFNQIMCIAGAADLPQGKNYESLEELCKDIVNRPLIATMKYDGEYNGKPKESIVNFKKTAHPNVQHKEKSAVARDEFAKPSVGFAVPNGLPLDDDLPFD